MEFDDTGWKSREYIKIHEAFLEFLVEHTLSWVERKATSNTEHCLWPALVSVNGLLAISYWGFVLPS